MQRKTAPVKSLSNPDAHALFLKKFRTGFHYEKLAKAKEFQHLKKAGILKQKIFYYSILQDLISRLF